MEIKFSTNAGTAPGRCDVMWCGDDGAFCMLGASRKKFEIRAVIVERGRGSERPQSSSALIDLENVTKQIRRKGRTIPTSACSRLWPATKSKRQIPDTQLPFTIYFSIRRRDRTFFILSLSCWPRACWFIQMKPLVLHSVISLSLSHIRGFEELGVMRTPRFPLGPCLQYRW